MSQAPRIAFIATALLAAPGVLWQAFEMYGLTAFGPQMLFFSIIHTMPVVVAIVVAAVPAMLVLFLQSSAALLGDSYRSRIGISKLALFAIAGFLVLHSLLLVFYDSWSSVAALRVLCCLLGVAALAGSFILGTASLRSHAQSAA